MKLVVSALTFFIFSTILSQAQEKIDTIYTFNKTILGRVKEVGHQDVLYTLPNEDVIYKVYTSPSCCESPGPQRVGIVN
jgi:hypothetical protein